MLEVRGLSGTWVMRRGGQALAATLAWLAQVRQEGRRGQLPTGAVLLRLPFHLEHLAVERQHLRVQGIGLGPLSQGLRKNSAPGSAAPRVLTL